MRLEATIADPRGEQLTRLAEELRVSKSQLVEEALTMFLKAVLETKLGRRLAIIDAASRQTICEMASPSLTQLEWTAHHAAVELTPESAAKMATLIEHPPEPTPALRRALARHRRP